jgi:hypothetical protein
VDTEFLKYNDEILAMAAIDMLFTRLNYAERQRVLKWTLDKFLRTSRNTAVIEYVPLKTV